MNTYGHPNIHICSYIRSSAPMFALSCTYSYASSYTFQQDLQETELEKKIKEALEANQPPKKNAKKGRPPKDAASAASQPIKKRPAAVMEGKEFIMDGKAFKSKASYLSTCAHTAKRASILAGKSPINFAAFMPSPIA